MNILHLDSDDQDNPLHGGQPVRTFQVNSRLAARHRIKVLTATFPGCRRRETQRGDIRYQRIGWYLPPFGLSPHLSFLAAAGPHLMREPHDLVVEEFGPPVGFGPLPLFTSRPIVTIVQWHSFEDWERRYHLPFERWMRRIGRLGARRNLIVQSESMERRFRALLPGARIRRIGCGVDIGASPKISNGEYALYLGRLASAEKGVDSLLACWKLRCAAEKIPLIVAGDGPDRQMMEAHSLGMDIQFAGRVDGARKRELLANCRLVVLPSRAETFGLVALEAMAAGKPVVAFDIENLRELLQPGWSVCVPAEDLAQLAGAICRLWRDPAACRALGAAARVEARRHDWNHVAAAQEDFYREIVDRSLQ